MSRNSQQAIFVNPAHGYEPLRLGIDVALELLEAVGAQHVLVPDCLPGARRLAREDFSMSYSKIIFDRALGDLYRESLLDISSYHRHLQMLLASRDMIEQNVAAGLRDWEEQNNSRVALEVITGSRIIATLGVPTLFIFQGLLSTILSRAMSHPMFNHDHNAMVAVARMMRSVESKYSLCMLPDDSPFINTVFLDHIATAPIRIPPPRRVRASLPEFTIQQPSAFIMLSGTGRGSSGREVAAKLDLPAVPSGLSDDPSGKNPVEVFGPNVEAVVTRGGSGTHWLCRQAGKPQVFTPFQVDDDPEIFFNVRHYVQIGAGISFGTGAVQRGQLQECTNRILALNDDTISTFGTLDGIRWIGLNYRSLLKGGKKSAKNEG